MTEAPDINLIPQKSFEEQPTKRKLFLWVVGVGRVIIITTELIAILVWLSRFRLDYEITTLQENIKEKAALVAMTSRFEKNFTNYQTKVNFIKQIDSEKTLYSKGLANLAQLTPNEVQFTSLDLSRRKIKLKAYTPSGAAFSNFIASLINSKKINKVILSSSQINHRDGSYLFTLTIENQKEFYSE